jgi:hypothetical protein
MTETQRQAYEEAKVHGFVVVSGPVYGTYKVNNKQYHSSTFEALMKNNLLRLINTNVDRHLIIETFETI